MPNPKGINQYSRDGGVGKIQGPKLKPYKDIKRRTETGAISMRRANSITRKRMKMENGR